MSKPTSAPNRLSGRELALERRKAMSRGGKAALKTTGQERSKSQSRPARAERAAESESPPATSLVPPARQAAARKEPFAAATASPQTAPMPEHGVNCGASNGRQRALERRRDMALRGKKALPRAGARSVGMARSGSVQSAQLEALARSQNVDCSNMSGREICQLRRQALSENGKTAMAAEPRRQDMLKASASTTAEPSHQASASYTDSDSYVAEDAVDAGLDQLCEQVESSRDESQGVTEPIVSTVRALCMARREAMAKGGKKGLRQRRHVGGLSRGVLPQEGSWKAAQRRGFSTREIARQRREELCQIGRGSADPARPCGRPKPEMAAPAPAKVEESTTLSGGHVTGTRVQRAPSVTGTEAGSCKSVTGTEYLELEHYDRFCGSQPTPNPAKVGSSHTISGQPVSGTEVGRSSRVTGDEAGSCGSVTGTEYLSSEQYAGFCGTQPEPGVRKVSVMSTRSGEPVSGTSVARSSKVTGDEAGSCRSVTGTEYMNTADSDIPCGTPSADGVPKVGVMHTLKGRQLTGTEVGRSTNVTGDEYGSCKPVTGTEYLGREQFAGFCGTAPRPSAPEKVHELRTVGDQSITGTAIGRSERVTGDETGSCANLTGTPYYNKADFGDVCREPAAGGVPKVGVMHTLRGREVSGTMIEKSLHVTGDEYGGCKPITGTEYVGSDHYAAFCGSRPEATPNKVTVGRTWNHQNVSGTAVGRSTRMTGDEYGACTPISGTPYIGPDQYDQFCEAPETMAADQRVAERQATPGHVVSGSQPGYDERVTGTARGACQNVSGAPYVGADEFGQVCDGPAPALHPRFQPPSMRSAATRPQPAPEPRPMPNGGFSVETPARTAQERRERRVTGTAYGNSSGITGPSNKAMGLVSGTDEFRYPDERQIAPAPAETEGGVQGAERVTVNGSSNGVTITGDDWQRGKNITGTEGLSTRRNTTRRGAPRGEGRSAYVNREIERKEVPPSRITGSSGNSGEGSLVTISGGARG